MKRFGPALMAMMVALSGPGFGAEAPQGLILHPQPKPVPEILFQDGEGRALTLADFHGKVVLLNIWATWCGPCREEMPTLDRLQAKLGGPDFEVVALSIDREGTPAITKFFGEVGVKDLAMYVDSSARAGPVLGAVGLPTSLLIDRKGQEIGRLVGPAEWDSPKMVEFIRGFLAKRGSQREAPHRSWGDGAAIVHIAEKGQTDDNTGASSNSGIGPRSRAGSSSICNGMARGDRSRDPRTHCRTGSWLELAGRGGHRSNPHRDAALRGNVCAWVVHEPRRPTFVFCRGHIPEDDRHASGSGAASEGHGISAG